MGGAISPYEFDEFDLVFFLKIYAEVAWGLYFHFLFDRVNRFLNRVFCCFVIYVVVLRSQSWMSAMSYSKSIVQGRWWKTVGYFIVLGVFGAAVVIAGGLVLGLPLVFLPDIQVLNIIVDTGIDLVASFFTVLYTVLFIHFDRTKEPPAIMSA